MLSIMILRNGCGEGGRGCSLARRVWITVTFYCVKGKVHRPPPMERISLIKPRAAAPHPQPACLVLRIDDGTRARGSSWPLRFTQEPGGPGVGSRTS